MFYCCFTRVVAVGKWFVQLEAFAIVVSPAGGGLTNGA
jgi:hypothetical protein